MKTVTKKSTNWGMLALAGVLAGATIQDGFAQGITPVAKPENAPEVAKPKSKTASGTLATASATQVKLTTDAGEMTVNLTPATEYWRVQESVKSTDLTVGDRVRFTLKGTDGLPIVQSLTPVTLKFGDQATLTLNKTEKMKFDLVTKITATELAAGQEAKIASNVFADGKMEAREVWVVVAPVKPTKTEAKPKA